jgi:hypothetical protein
MIANKTTIIAPKIHTKLSDRDVPISNQVGATDVYTSSNIMVEVVVLVFTIVFVTVSSTIPVVV